MKKIIMILVAMMAMVTLQSKAQKVETIGNVYMFGVAYSAVDSVVYMTDVMKVEDAKVQKHTKFLFGRADYSSQLRKYMVEDGVKNRTCAVSFAIGKAKAEKKYLKMKANYQKKGFLVKLIGPDSFAFKPIEWNYE